MSLYCNVIKKYLLLKFAVFFIHFVCCAVLVAENNRRGLVLLKRAKNIPDGQNGSRTIRRQTILPLILSVKSRTGELAEIFRFEIRCMLSL